MHIYLWLVRVARIARRGACETLARLVEPTRAARRRRALEES